jgi:hypothetical protein
MKGSKLLEQFERAQERCTHYTAMLETAKAHTPTSMTEVNHIKAQLVKWEEELERIHRTSLNMELENENN